MSSPRRGPILAAVVAVMLTFAAALVDLGGGFDLTQFLRVGEHSSAREFVEADLPDTHLVTGWGHDGQANYVLAATFPDLPQAEGVVDSATYRARRIVYPALVSWVPRGMPLVVALFVLNLVAVAGAAAAVAAIARDHGGHWIVGAAVGLSPAFVASTIIDLGDGLALALAATGLAIWRRDDGSGTGLAVVAFSLAALTRETSLVIPAAVFLLEARGRRLPLLVPPVALVAWLAAIAVWLDDSDKSAAQFRPPLLGCGRSGRVEPGGGSRIHPRRRVRLGRGSAVGDRPDLGDRAGARRRCAPLRRPRRPVRRPQPGPGDPVGRSLRRTPRRPRARPRSASVSRRCPRSASVSRRCPRSASVSRRRPSRW